MKKLLRTLTLSASSAALLLVPVVGAVVLFPGLTTPAFAVKGHKHSHINAHALLGDNIKKDGKHSLGSHGGRPVTAEVKNGKVVNMTIGDLKVTKVVAHQKMAGSESGLIKAAYQQLAQYDSSPEYGYCSDDGYETTCYWYYASDVDPNDGYWEEYTTYDS
jgi:hypothetical protein